MHNSENWVAREEGVHGSERMALERRVQVTNGACSELAGCAYDDTIRHHAPEMTRRKRGDGEARSVMMGEHEAQRATVALAARRVG